MQILSDDFAAVDLCEEPCHNGLPKKVKLTERNKKGDKQQNGTTRGERKGSGFASGSAQNAAVSPRRLSVIFPKRCEVVQLFVVNMIVSIWQFIRFSK